MSVFAENDDLTFGIVVFCVVLVLFFDALLELEDDGAGCVDDFDVVAACDCVGFWGLAVGSKEYFRVVQPA